jgi:hypothetical protein
MNLIAEGGPVAATNAYRSIATPASGLEPASRWMP